MSNKTLKIAVLSCRLDALADSVSSKWQRGSDTTIGCIEGFTCILVKMVAKNC
jgi:hypothetical protein